MKPTLNDYKVMYKENGKKLKVSCIIQDHYNLLMLLGKKQYAQLHHHHHVGGGSGLLGIEVEMA